MRCGAGGCARSTTSAMSQYVIHYGGSLFGGGDVTAM